MDAAQLFRKFSLYFAGALLVASAASAQTINATPDQPVTFTAGVTVVTLQLSMSDGSTPTFTVNKANGGDWYTVSPSSGTLTPGTTLTVTKGTLSCEFTGCSTSFTVTAGTASKTISVINSNTAGGGGNTGTLSATPANVTLSAALGNFGFGTTQVSNSASTTQNFQATISSTCNCLSFSTTLPSSISPGVAVTLGVTGNSSGLTNNRAYTGQIVVTSGSSTLNIPVTFTVGTAGSTGTLTANLNPNPLAFSYPNGTTLGAITVTSTTSTAYTATATSSGGWLQVNFATSSTGTSNSGALVYVSVNTNVSQFMATGTYQGTVTLTNSSNSADVTTIPVTLAVNGGGGGTGTGGSIAPTSLTFNYQVGTGSPAYQEILVPVAGTYTVQTTGAFVSTSAGGGQFTVQSGQTGTLLVLPAVAGFAAGSYPGSVTLTSNTGTSQMVSVTLNVSSSPVLNARVNGIAGDLTCTTASGACNAATLQITASDNSAQTISTTSSVSWITLEGGNAATPSTYNVRLATSGLPTGTNTGTITVSSNGAGAVTVPVAVYVPGTSGGGGTGSLTLGASSLTFSAAGSQTLSVTATTATNYTASVPTSGCAWLSISPSGSLNTGTTSSLTVTVNGSGLNAGQTYSCNISLVSAGGTQTVGVNFNVPSGGGGSGSISVSKTSLTFSTPAGATPATQEVVVTGASGATGTGFSVSVQSSPSGWLTATPTTGTTPGTVTVGATVTGLAAGAYSGNVTITATGGNSVQIPVTLTVTAATSISASPTSLTFAYVAGNANPAAQTVNVTGTGTNLTYTATVSADATWLSVTPASGTAPATLSVAVNPGSLTPGTYNGTITVAGGTGGQGSTAIAVTLTVTAPLPTISRVTNAASFNTGSVAAGEIITLFGIGMGPAQIQVATPTSNQYPTTLGGVTVTVGGYIAPLIYVRNDQISAIVPYEINRPFIANATILVRYLNQSSNGVSLPQVGAAPGIFTAGSGTGQGAVLNANLSVNSAGNPAGQGEVVVLYVTGEGVTTPASVTGRVTPATAPYPQPVSGVVTVTIDGLPATVQFYGAAPGLVSGVMQVNAVVPAGASSGSVPVVVKVGDATSQLTAQNIGAVTIAVK